ncbi:MAG: IS1380 family transposase [Actinobacteria bacterium]|nr:IS1380 family transposase [Actinomycetota bacterium]
MEVTLKVNAADGDRAPGRISFRVDDESLTAFGGLAVTGALARRLGLVGLIDGELAREGRAAPVKQRRRGVSGGELVVAIAESQLTGGECFDDLEDLRGDRAGGRLRAALRVPSAATARQLARRFRRCHLQAVERALARVGGRLDRALGREADEQATIDLDATQIEVYGAKAGAARSRHGFVSYAPHVAVWAERGRALCGELVGGNREKLTAHQAATVARRALRMLRASGHAGLVTFRVDSAYYAIELLAALNKAGARFTVSGPRSQAMWRLVGQIAEDAWSDADGLDAAQVAEIVYRPDGWTGEPLRLIVRRILYTAAQISSNAMARRRKTIHPDQLALLADGHTDQVYGYSFILTDLADRSAVCIERFHRHRAQIEERLKDAKLGQALRRMPTADHNANRVWMTACLTALNLAAMVCDLCPAAGASGKAPADAPLRRAAKTLRQLLFCVPARIITSARQTILRLPAGYRHADILSATYHAALTLPAP